MMLWHLALDLFIDFLLAVGQALVQSVAIVDYADRRGKSNLACPVRNDQGLVRIRYPAANDRVDVDLELCVVAEGLRASHRALSNSSLKRRRIDVVDRDLQVVQAGFVQLLDLFDLKVIPVRDQPGDHAMMSNACNDLVDLGVHHRFAAGDRDHGRTKFSELIDPRQHRFDRHRIARLIELVTVSTRQIATAASARCAPIRDAWSRRTHEPWCLTPRVNLLKPLAFGINPND